GIAQKARVELDDVNHSIQSASAEMSRAKAEALKKSLRAKCREALAFSDRATDLDPQNETAWVQKVRAWRMLKQFKTAELTLRRALQIFPASADLKEQQKLIRAAKASAS